MKKTAKTKFETVPISEVRQKAREIDGEPRVKKILHKEEPYAVAPLKHTTARTQGA